MVGRPVPGRHILSGQKIVPTFVDLGFERFTETFRSLRFKRFFKISFSFEFKPGSRIEAL